MEREFTTRPDSDIRRARALSRFLDGSYADPILGLIAPGAGDLITGLVGLYIIGVAVRHRVPKVVIARMLVNVAIDTLLGFVPVVGDAFDFVFRANQRNIALLDARHEDRQPKPWDWLIVGAALGLVLVAIAVPIALLIFTIRLVF